VVKGDVPYTADEMLLGAGFEKGMLLYALDEKTVEENVMYNLPFVDSFKMKRFWPGTVVFEVEKSEPSMYITLADENFILSQSMRVLSQTKDFSFIESENLVHVKLSSVERCVAGEFLVTKDNSSETAKEIYSLLCDNSLVSDVGEIDITDKFDISFSYGNNYVVELGDNRSLDKKIHFMIGIVNQLHEGTSGIIDVSDENVKEGILKSF
jgi:cell division septal protein FtsQ